MLDPWVILTGLAILLAVGFLLNRILKTGRPGRVSDLYLEALEAWSAGDLERAEFNLKQAVKSNPQGVDSFLKLGDLLRLRGQPDRAAVLHRGLIARADLPDNRRIQAALSLAEDLLELSRYAEAGQVLDTLVRRASGSDRYWWARFAQWTGTGDAAEAARALKYAADHLEGKQRAEFREAYGFYQLDRAYAAALAQEYSTALSLCKKIPSATRAKNQEALVQATVRVKKGDAKAGMDIAAAGLESQPEALVAFQSVLRPALLDQGQFARSIPLLERVAQQPEVPVPLLIELALLYAKTGRHDEAIDLLVRKQGRKDLTCWSAFPFLHILIREGCDAGTRDLWDALHHPCTGAGWSCPACGAQYPRYGWFCPGCLKFGTLRPGNLTREGEP